MDLNNMNFNNLDYPLNLFALALKHDEGVVRYLHFGFFERDDESTGQAQENATRRLLALLPAPPAKVLEVGIGLGITAGKLEEMGYHYHGITPDARQIETCQAPGRRLDCVRFEDISDTEGEFDVLLFQESAQYMWPETLLRQAHRLLRIHGYLLIADEMPRTSAEGLETLAWRCGFRIDYREDVSRQVIPAYQHLVNRLSAHAEQFETELALPAGHAHNMTRYLADRMERYERGDYRYQLLRLRPNVGASSLAK